jgi:hypothetical protein
VVVLVLLVKLLTWITRERLSGKALTDGGLETLE